MWLAVNTIGGVVSTHSRPKAAGIEIWIRKMVLTIVSTHSRPKAAGASAFSRGFSSNSFNTQPPEGGWSRGCTPSPTWARFQHTAARRRLAKVDFMFFLLINKFQHTAARRRLAAGLKKSRPKNTVSTHSRPKAAGFFEVLLWLLLWRFNTQPPEGGWLLLIIHKERFSCFNTQPPEGGWMRGQSCYTHSAGFQHTAARRRLDGKTTVEVPTAPFQHTAARRRLG